MTDNDDNAGMTSAQSPEAIGVHTSGPWTATFSFPGLTPGIGDTWQIDCEGHAVCTTQFCYAPNTEANARLIAAAPDLLRELEEVRDWLALLSIASAEDVMQGGPAMFESVSSAIAKALGQ